MPNEIDRATNFKCECRRKPLQKYLSPLKTQNGPVPISQLENVTVNESRNSEFTLFGFHDKSHTTLLVYLRTKLVDQLRSMKE